VITYLSSNWISTHFFQPNSVKIETYLTELRDKVHKLLYKYNEMKGI